MRGTRRALLASLLVALSVVLGYALAGIPNVELMTITVFLSGYLLGVRLGIVVGIASIVIHSLFNPLGAPMPPLLLSQAAGFSVIGAGGAVFAPLLQRMSRRSIAVLLAGLVGFVLTLFYDILTSVAAFFVATGRGASEGLVAFVLGGLFFMGMHIVWNTGLFLFALKPMLSVLCKYHYELS